MHIGLKLVNMIIYSIKLLFNTSAAEHRLLEEK